MADYNWITPDQYNDMHTGLTGGFQGLTGDAANIAQGDNFLSQVIPMIMASQAYKDHGAIIIWWDESESNSGERSRMPGRSLRLFRPLTRRTSRTGKLVFPEAEKLMPGRAPALAGDGYSP